MRRFRVFAGFVAVSLLAAACTAGQGTGSGSAKDVLTISNENGENWDCNFNPFNSSDTLVSMGFVYETLAFVNSLENGKATPMLASSWTWGPGDKTITFTIRQGVKFSNGTPMTAADVVYTFDMIKAHSAMDLGGVWSVLSSVSQTGSDQVTMDFKAPSVPDFYYIAGQVPIVPQSVWSKISNPVTYPDTNPVGTGPYVVQPCTPQNITYVASKHYWQPGEPHITKVEYPAFTSNNTANDELSTGQAQWGSQYIPGIKAFYTSKSPSYHYWFPPTENVTLIPNLTYGPLKNVKVRQAMSYAINRSRVSLIGESGYEPPANQAGIVTPTFSSWLDTSQLASYGNYSYNPTKAKQLLESAGYHLGSNGIMTNSAGQQLSFQVINIGDFSDWVADMQVIAQDLKAVGIQLTADNLTDTSMETALYNGKYQLAYFDQLIVGPEPYYEMRNWLDSAGTAPIGQPAATNYERYINPATDALFNEYAATTSPAMERSIIDQVEQVMLSDVPIIPVVEAVDWYQYDTSAFTGWPTASDPYAQPAAYAYPDNEQVLLHLKSN
jgi:peptide/nickel transport system substrate-binding protein